MAPSEAVELMLLVLAVGTPLGIAMVTPADSHRLWASEMKVASSAALQAVLISGRIPDMKAGALQTQARSVMVHFDAPKPFSTGVF